MKVLFVCQGNVGRSQVAEGLFKKLSPHEATSAGTRADEALARTKPASRKLKDVRDQRMVRYMNERGIDISENERTQLTLEMVEEADKVVVIAEKETWPDYLVESEKVIAWDIPDSLGMDDAFALDVYDQVTLRVEELVKEIG